MKYVVVGFTVLVALIHGYFMVLESFLWTTPTGLKVFGLSAADAETTRVLAFNQGLYNGGVAALLAWALWAKERKTILALLVFIIAMGIVGGLTAKPTIIAFQSVPAAIALGLQWFKGERSRSPQD